MKLTFISKDPLIAKFYDQTFRKLFEEHLAWVPVDAYPTALGIKTIPELQQFMQECMLAEARFHEHYDYVTDENGVRHVIYEDGQPKLMIPEVRVEE